MPETGCGEGRDAKAVFEKGYNLTAVDVSEEAVNYCKKNARLQKQFPRFGLFVLKFI